MMTRKKIGILVALAATLVLALLGGCGNPLSLAALVDGPDGEPLSVTPASGTIVVYNSVTLTASGGIPPYTYQVTAGNGSVSDNIFTASAQTGEEVVTVTDASGASVEVVFQVEPGAVGFGVTPSSQTVYTGDTITFTAIGASGTPEYTFVDPANDNQSGASLDPVTGVYQAGPLDAGTPSAIDTITVSDGSNSATASITVVQKDLAINTITATVVTGGSLDLVNVGGTGDFSYEVTTDNSGVPDDMTGSVYPSGTAATYVAGPTGGVTDVVTMTDDYDGRTREANISVIAATLVEDVDYDADPVTLGSAPPFRTGDGFTASSGVTNIGTAAGAADVRWTVYASTDTTIGGADFTVASGTITGGLVSGDSSGITINGTWPPVAGSYHLLIDVRADDDVKRANNVEQTAGPSDVAPVVSISPSVFTVYPGQSITFAAQGESPLSYGIVGNNSGADPMAGATYQAGPTPGLDTIRVTDALGGTADAEITVAVPPAGDVEYVVASITSGNPTPDAGSLIAESFTLQNTGADSGIASVSWSAYLSRDADLVTGPNYLVDSGVEPPLGGAGGGSDTATVSISGNWPSSTGAWYLIVQAQSDDEGVPEEWTASAAFDVQTVDVDYYVSVPPPGGAPEVGTDISEEFTIRNQGSSSGSADLSWSVYRSTDANYGSGDELLASGTIVGGLSNGGTQGPIPIPSVPGSASWPGTEQTNYLIVRLDASDDVNGANDTYVSDPYYVSSNIVDYQVTSITADDPAPKAGTLIGESFTIMNTGAADGSQDLTWELYVSTTASASGGVVASGTVAGGLTAGSSYTVSSIPAAWPDAPGDDRYLVVVVTAADDANSLNDETPQGPFTLQGAPDYAVIAPTLPVVTEGGNSDTGEVLGDIGAHSFTIDEVAGYPGGDPVQWSAHWSLDSTLDGTDIEIDSGILSGTETTWPMPITLPGTTPLPSSWGYWRILIDVEAADDASSSNDSYVSAEIPVWQTTGNVDTDATTTDDDLYVGEEDDFAILLNPGDTVEITGNIDNDTYNDLFKVTLGAGVTALRAVATWVTGRDTLDLYMYQLGDDPLTPPYRAVEITDDIEDSDAVTAPDSPWTGLSPGGEYYVNVYSIATGGDAGQPYTLTITGN